jgi:hypothetical protein
LDARRVFELIRGLNNDSGDVGLAAENIDPRTINREMNRAFQRFPLNVKVTQLTEPELHLITVGSHKHFPYKS